MSLSKLFLTQLIWTSFDKHKETKVRNVTVIGQMGVDDYALVSC